MGRRRGATRIARQSLVIDASVGVKWFSRKLEADLAESDALVAALEYRDVDIWVPDLFFYKVGNVLAKKPQFSNEMAEAAVHSLWDLGLRVAPVDESLLLQSVSLARQAGITVYDACYCALAAATGYALVTANPRHQGKASRPGCKVISLKNWQAP